MLSQIMDTVEPWYVSKDTPQCRVRYWFFYSNVMLSHILKKVEPWWFNHDLTSNMASLIFEVDLRIQAHVSDIRWPEVNNLNHSSHSGPLNMCSIFTYIMATTGYIRF